MRWFDQHGRKHLPWQQEPTPYQVWVSEIMLQQTQVATVIPYFERFMRCFPGVSELAEAPLDSVLECWTGLGYYARARNLHKAAQQIMSDCQGIIPSEQEALESLPGIGRSTAGAIRALAFHQHAVILDGNVKRVLARYHAISGWPGTAAVMRQLWALATDLTPLERVANYTQAIMDLGSQLCTRSRPHCVSCPLRVDCKAHAQGNPTAYPGRKPRKERPRKSVQMLLLRNQSREILLVKRPSSGIWGGLWSFPETPDGESPDSYLLRQYGVTVLSSRSLASVRHQFTHFQLTIRPLLLDVSESANRIMEMAPQPMLWYNTAHPAPGGFPAPVARLLQQYQVMTDTTGAD